MFKANTDNSFVPTKTISIKPEAQVDYNPKTQNQVRWLIPQYVGFFDPRATTLKYKLQFSGRGHNKPDFRAGVHSLWRDIRIRDGTASTELEMIQDYNALTSQWWGYTANESHNHKRDLFEGRSANQDIDQQLFYGSSGDWSNGAVTTTFDKKKVEINQPIYSGVLGGDKVFPVVATKGLRCEMTLDQLQRSLINNVTLGTQAEFVQLKTAKAQDGDQKVGVDSQFNILIQRPADASTGRGVNRDCSPTNNNPFDIGDIIYCANRDDGLNEEALGVVVGFNEDGDQDLQINYIPARANGVGLTHAHPDGSQVFYKSADRVNGAVVTNVPAQQITDAGTPINYTISDLEMLLLQVQPPAGYVQSLLSQVGSEKGLNMDFRTWTLYRFNLTTTNGLTNQLIPANQQRAYTILSVPLDIGNQNDIRASSFQALTDGVQNYQYVFGGSLIPDRPIDLQRYNQSPARIDALHVVELEKALVNANYGVRNLLRIPERFMIGRAFSKYGQVFNLSPQSLSLRVEYSGATKEKLYEHFVQFLRRVNISPNGVMVMS
jgi:hypothetical protein